MSFFIRNNNQICYAGDNIPGIVMVAEAVNPEVADSLATLLNEKHADAALQNGVLTIVQP